MVVLVAIFVVGLPMLLCLGLQAFVGDPHPMHADRPFDRGVWMRFDVDAPTGYSWRLPMAQSLIDDGSLDGASRAQVEALLGPPDDARWSERYPYPAWWVGTHPSPMASDGAGLAIAFDEAGRVTRVHALWH